HIAYACTDFQNNLDLYTKLMGYKQRETETVESEGIEVTFLSPQRAEGDALPDTAGNEVSIELIRPLNEEGALFKSIQKRGTGLHHVCFRVPSLDKAIKEATDRGLKLLPGFPKKGSRGKDIAFFSPKETG